MMTFWFLRSAYVLIISALLLPSLATACSCPFVEPAGFVHASLKHFPANARGMLFMTPQGDPPPVVTEQDFVITSSKQAGPLGVALSYPALPAGRRELALQQLVRVGPSDGFKAGARYTVRYVGPARNWAYPTSIDFTVDAVTVEVKSLPYRLQLDGPPERRLLLRSDGRGACASQQPAIVQDFHYVLPAALQPYQQAVIHFSEMRSARKFEPMTFTQNICTPPLFGATAYEEERDLVQVDCKKPGATRTIRGQVGFLELEDSLQTTEPLSIDLRKAVGKACYGMGMVKEALARGDAQQALNLVCQLPYEQPYDGIFIPYAKPRSTPKTPPPVDALRQLAARATEEQRLCIAKITGGL
jgi:hypothetical protein